jgi:ABC-2 type transport system permease protein
MTTILPRRGLLAAEWTKLRSVRSTPFILLFAGTATVTIGVVQARSAAQGWDSWSPRDRAEFDPVFGVFTGFQLAQFAFALLGVLAVSTEFGTGTIRQTFIAAPRRQQVLTAKLTVVGGLALAAGEALAFLTFFAGQFVLASKQLDVSLADPHVLRAVLGQGFYLFAVTVIGVGIGAAIRHTAGAVATVTGLLFLTVMVFKAFTGAEPSNLTHWALSSAAEGLTWTTVQAPEWPSAGEGLLVCLTYLAATTGLAALSLRKRDI